MAERFDPTQHTDIFHRVRVIMTDPTIIAQEWEVGSKEAERIREKVAIVLAGHVIAVRDIDQVVLNIVALAEAEASQLVLDKANLILPSSDILAAQLELKEDHAKIINRMTAVVVASILEVAAEMHQSLMDLKDVANAQGDAAAAAYRVRKASEDFIDKNRGVNTILYNLFVWIMGHVPTIRYIFEIVNLADARAAASQMKKSRAIAVADAIYEGAGIFGLFDGQEK